MQIHSKLIARLINLFSKHYLFSQEWRKGDGIKNWFYERGIIESATINVELLRLRGYDLLTNETKH
jgi:hypothetical protein